MSYADIEFYTKYSGDIPPDDVKKALRTASRHIDILTYNRIRGTDFNNLTEFQKEIIKECCCEMADFEYDNADMIESVLQEYAINGVSMKFGESWNLHIQNGVAVRRDTYEMLKQTGLCIRKL